MWQRVLQAASSGGDNALEVVKEVVTVTLGASTQSNMKKWTIPNKKKKKPVMIYITCDDTVGNKYNSMFWSAWSCRGQRVWGNFWTNGNVGTFGQNTSTVGYVNPMSYPVLDAAPGTSDFIVHTCDTDAHSNNVYDCYIFYEID